MKALVFGASGRTGACVAEEVRRRGWELLAPAHAECDLEQPDAVADYVLAHPADLVVNCAAVSGLEACADDPLRAHRINAMSPAAMALACRHTGARFIHLSTDYVLDGRQPGFKAEDAHCRPEGWYAQSKREGEQEVLEALPSAVVARVSWICGNPRRPAFVEQMLGKALDGQPLAAIADKYSMPTDARDIARAVLQLAETDFFSIIHMCSGAEGESPLSWWDCAQLALQEAVRLGALPSLPEITRQKLADASFFREPRPRHTAMDNSRLRGLGIPMPSARETVAAVAARFLQVRA
ncbi:MAG: NAD(P)-dependent oxidoreductase [Akkermansia sp.]|nr:NAD(P)-dependent oxidoreductase [Akkermansia sp.]